MGLLVMELYPEQKAAVEDLSNGKILRGGTGSGKTITSVAYYMKKEAPKRVIVITTAKKRDTLDWESEFAMVGVGKAEDATVAGVLTVDSWQNIGKYTDVHGAFFIFDEKRLEGFGKWSKAFIHIAKSNRWIILTATPGDNWLDYATVFIANGHYKNITQFKREHVVYASYVKFPKVERYVGVNKLVKLRNELLVEMPYHSHTVRHDEVVWVDYDKEMFKCALTKRWNPFLNQPIRDVAELFAVMRKVVNSDATRMHAVRTLMEAHSRLIVFYNFNYELELLRELSKDVPLAEWNGHKHEEIPDTERWVYLVQYMAGAEGWNCTSTNATVFYSLSYSYKNVHQAKGRIDRRNTPFVDLYYYTLMSRSAIDIAIAKALGQKRNFNEKEFAGGGVARDR
jgi:hypothetical protein